MNEELLKSVYYWQLSIFQRWIYDCFMKNVYPKIKKHHKSHIELIDQKLIGHPVGYSNCVSCKYRELLRDKEN